jgi:competence protein ComEC
LRAAASGRKPTAACQTSCWRKFSSGSLVQVDVQVQVHVRVKERAYVYAYGVKPWDKGAENTIKPRRATAKDFWWSWGDTPFVALTACLAAGIAISAMRLPCSFAALAVASAALISAAGLALIRNRLGLCLCLGLCAMILDGVLLGLAERNAYSRDDVRSLLARGSLPLGELLLLDGCVLEDSAQRGTDSVTVLDLHGLRRKDSWAVCRGKVQLRVTVPADTQIPGAFLKYGDRVRAWAACDVPRNFQNPGSNDRVSVLARRGIHLLARARSPRLIEVLPRDCGTTWDHTVASARRVLRAQIANFAGEAGPLQAAVLASIVLGDYSGLDAGTRAAFQNTGTYHVLVVSGLHVSWIAWVLTRLLRVLGLPAGAARLLAACGIFFYTCLVGFQASISRALWVFTLYLIGQSLFRRASPVNIILACAFLLLTAQPGWLWDPGFQLSFLSVAAIVLMALPIIEQRLRPLLDPLRHAGDLERLSLEAGKWQFLGRHLRFRAELCAEACADRFHPRLERLALACCRAAASLGMMIAGMMLISLAVQVWIEPVLAYYFNRLSWVAPVANLAMIPLSSLVLASGMTAEIVYGVAPAAWPVFPIAGTLCTLLLNVNRWFSALPGAWQRCPTPSGFWVLAGLVLLFVWCFLRRRRLWLPCAFVGIQLAGLSLAGSGFMPPSGTEIFPAACESGGAANPAWLRLAFLDVGQGDSIVIEFPDGRVWVMDAGGIRVASDQPDDASLFDIGEVVVSRFLWSRWITALDRLVVTHAHQDHAGGMPALLGNFRVKCLDMAESGEDPILARLMAAARSTRVPVRMLAAGDGYSVAGVAAHIINPPRGRRFRALNDNSLAMRLEFGRFSALLAGDMEGPAEAGVVEREPELRSTLLKVAHHGSRNATLDPLLDRVMPRWAVISAGRRNPFDNPSRETLLRLLRHGSRPLLTMDLGTIFLETDGTHYALRSHVLGILETGELQLRH